ncbi:MAG: hypothetical protein J7493_10435 [Porphyrobacter sp.]|nr:hypothetical protein [Porphyrobacter sp.]
MATYTHVFEFNDLGLNAFKRIFEGTLNETAIDPLDPHYATRLSGTGSFSDASAETSKELAERLLNALGREWSAFLPRAGVWAWLTFILRDVVLPRDAEGNRRPGEVHRWYPSDPGDYQKAQRHLVRMPVVLLGNLGDAADHLLCGSPSKLPEIREQLTSQQDMFSPEFQRAARRLYFDDSKGGLKRGGGGKGAGTPRRLAKVRQQLDVTWNLFDLEAEQILNLLPKEFDRFSAARG